MSVLSRPRTSSRSHDLAGAPVVPAPRPASHDGGLTATGRARPGTPEERTTRRRRAALVLVALVAALAGGVTTAVVQLTDDPPAPGTTQLSGVTELDTIRDEMLQRRSIIADSERATDAQRDAVLANR